MDIGLENRLDRVLIRLVWESKGRSYFWEDKGDRTLGKSGRSRFGNKRAIVLPSLLNCYNNSLHILLSLVY
ncbi:hypothetical protein Q5691_23950 [Microcoleus sp. w1-18aA5]|uniref:hypothetical protein n=1 Tax=Microcoleus sp. w1-18aA5 TaxID=2818982 RepID=UPI002FD6439A